MYRLVLAIIAAMCFAGVAAPADVRASDVTNAAASKTALLNGLKPADEIAPRLAKIKSSIVGLSRPQATKKSQMASLKTGLKETDLLDQSLVKLRKGFEAAESRVGVSGGADAVDRNRDAVAALREAFKQKTKDLETGDKLGNFEIQDLMSRYNQTETASSSVTKKLDDTRNAVIGKIG